MGQKGAALSIRRLLKYFQKFRASGRFSGLFEELPESDRALMTRWADLRCRRAADSRVLL